MATTIFVKNLIIIGTHGAHLPTAQPKEFKLDIDITVNDIGEALATDDIAHVYDYRHAVTIAQRIIKGSSVHLIETLASKIIDALLEDPKAHYVKLTITKREPGSDYDSGITLEK